MTDIELFFEDPSQNHGIPRRFSILYLLRRDISVCFGIDIVSGKTLNFKALWPGTMAILAGIDLLGKFYAGDDDLGKVGDRFKGYIDAFFNSVSNSDKDVIYQLRNSLLHSFGLYSKDRKGREYNFVVDEVNGPIVEILGGDKYKIDLITLKNIFDLSIDSYKAKLLGDSSLQLKFNNIFQKYGYTNVW
jgi:hypothetical protein